MLLLKHVAHRKKNAKHNKTLDLSIAWYNKNRYKKTNSEILEKHRKIRIISRKLLLQPLSAKGRGKC